MGWAERTKEGQKRVSHRDTRVPLIDRPGIVAVVSGDRTTYPQFAGCVAAIQSTPGSYLWWELTGGGGVAEARNQHVRRALHQFKGRPFWLWFIDDDHQFEPDILGSLLRRNKDLIVPLVLFRVPPHGWVGYEYFPVDAEMTDEELIAAWDRYTDPPTLEPGQTSGIVEMGQGGTGGLLISSEVLRAMPDPWFEFGKGYAAAAGEDGWFILKARRLGFQMFCDLSARMSHMNTCSVWPKLEPDGSVSPLFQISQAPRLTDYAFAAPEGSADKWLAADVRARRDPTYIGGQK